MLHKQNEVTVTWRKIWKLQNQTCVNMWGKMSVSLSVYIYDYM